MAIRNNKRRSQIKRVNKKRELFKRESSFAFPWKKAGWLSLLILPLALFIGAHQWINNSENLTISTVKVVGELKVLDEAKLQALIAPYTKTNLYLLDAELLEKELENNPWVQSASMTLILPDTLKVRITEHNPIAFWGDKAMLADDGTIINAVWDEPKIELPTLYSPTDKGRNMAQGFIQIRKWMKGFPIKMVEFKEDSRGSWQIRLENDLVLKIGRNQQEKRLRRFMVAYNQRLKGAIENIKAIDLRYTNGFAVQWKSDYSNQG